MLINGSTKERNVLQLMKWKQNSSKQVANMASEQRFHEEEENVIQKTIM